MGKKGKREFVQVLRLLEIFQIADVEAGIQSASNAAQLALMR